MASNMEAEIVDESPVVQWSQEQRWPLEGEPVCLVCGRYGEYILDETEDDVCSIECKKKRLESLRRKPEMSLEHKSSATSETSSLSSSSMTPEQLEEFYKKVSGPWPFIFVGHVGCHMMVT